MSIRHAIAIGCVFFALPFVANAAEKSDASNPVIEAPKNPSIVYEPGRKNAATLPPPSADATRQSTAPFKQPRISFKTGPTMFGDVVRKIGDASHPSLVLMNGLEHTAIKELSFKNIGFDKAVDQMCNQTKSLSQRCPNYTFIYPAGYGALQNVSLANKLDPAFNIAGGGMAFGSGLRLFTVFSWISYALQTTIVADNAVAEARCGEITLGDIPLTDALEAILKSARVANVSVDSTDDYIFFSVPGNTNPRSALLNADALDDTQKKFLDQRKDLILPVAPIKGKPVEMARDPLPLKDVLPALSEQLGVKVVAEEGLEKLPVNPVIFRKARVQTILDLLVRQWLEPIFGYQVLQDRIVIRKR